MTAVLKNTAAQAHFDPKVGARVYSVLPGDHLVLEEAGSAIVTLLGSCVAACIRDRNRGIGGLNHFLLPGDGGSQSARYGAYAMEVLVNGILSAGGSRDALEAKVFGGGEVIASTGSGRVGAKNARFVREYLKSEGIPIRAEDLGGPSGRRVYFFPETGQVRVQYLAAPESQKTAEGELRLDKSLSQKPASGGVELFG